MLERARAGRHVPAQQPVRRRTRSGTTCPAECRSRSSRRSCKFYVIDADKVARGPRPRRPHQHHHADLLLRASRACCPREEAIDADQGGHQEDLRRQGRAVVKKNYEAVDRALDESARSQGAEGRHEHNRDAAAGRQPTRPEFVQEGHRPHHRRSRATTCPVSAMPVDGTLPVGHARSTRSATSRRSSRSGTRDICIQCGTASSSARTRASAPRSTTRSSLADAPDGFKTAKVHAKGCREPASTRCRSPPRTAPAARSASSLPGEETSDQVGKRAINMVAKPPSCSRSSKATRRLLRQLPEIDPATIDPSNAQAASQLPRAAVRVLGRVRRLRRDAVRQAAHPALRRPA